MKIVSYNNNNGSLEVRKVERGYVVSFFGAGLIHCPNLSVAMEVFSQLIPE